MSVKTQAWTPEAHQLATLHSNVVVKIPMLAQGLQAVHQLAQEGIRTNVTLCFSASQALLGAKAGASYISPFVGRLDDTGHTGMHLVRDIVTMYKNHALSTKVLATSLRSPLHVVEAALAGAHVATLPPKVLRQMLQHPLTDSGLERFLSDWKKVPSRAGIGARWGARGGGNGGHRGASPRRLLRRAPAPIRPATRTAVARPSPGRFNEQRGGRESLRAHRRGNA
jgi:transaldolase